VVGAFPTKTVVPRVLILVNVFVGRNYMQELESCQWGFFGDYPQVAVRPQLHCGRRRQSNCRLNLWVITRDFAEENRLP